LINNLSLKRKLEQRNLKVLAAIPQTFEKGLIEKRGED